MNDADMCLAAKRVVEIGGGQVVVLDGKVIAEIALPYAGLVSDEPLENVVTMLDKVHAAFPQLGSKHDNIFAALSFISLSPLPELRLTTKGLVDVKQFKLIDLFGS
jgi:adenine deaminase